MVAGRKVRDSLLRSRREGREEDGRTARIDGTGGRRAQTGGGEGFQSTVWNDFGFGVRRKGGFAQVSGLLADGIGPILGLFFA